MAAPRGWQRTDAYRLANPDADEAAGKNTPATNSLVFGIISLLFNPFLLIGILALILGIVGLRRANNNYPFIGRSKAVWGIALSSIGTVISLIIIIALL